MLDDLIIDDINNEPINVVLDDTPAPELLKTETKQEQKKEEELIEVQLPEDETDNKSNTSTPAKEDVAWKEVVRFGLDKGIFTDVSEEDLEKFDGSLDGFAEVLQKELATGIEVAKTDWINQTLANPLSRELIQHLENGGDINDFIKVNKSNYASFDEKQIEVDKNSQRNIMFDFYKRTTNWDNERINKMIQRHDDLDELKGESKFALGQLKQLEVQEKQQMQERLKQQKIENEKLAQQRIDFINNEIINMKEFAGITINNKVKQQIADAVYDNKTFDKINKNVDKYRVVLATLDTLGVLDGNLEMIQKIQSSNATKNVKKEIESYDFRRGSTNTNKKSANKGDDTLKSLMKQIGHDPFQY